MFKVATKNLLGHKLRTLFTAIAVALGVAFMAGTFVLTDTVSASFDTIFTDAFSGIDAQVRGQEAFASSDLGPDQRPDIDLSTVEVVRGVDGVKAAEPVVQGFTAVLDDDGNPLNPNGIAFGANWTGVPEVDVFTVEEGRAPTGPKEALVDEDTASAGDFAVGDTFTVQTINGRIELDVAGVVEYGDSGNLGGASFILMDTPDAIATFNLGGKIQSVAVIGDEGVSPTQLVDRIEPALPDGTEAITGETAAEEAQDAIGSFVGTIRTFLTVFALIALAAGSFLIYNTFAIVIGQRVRELALLRAMGASRAQVLRSVVVEAGFIGLIASLLGLVGGVLLAFVLQSFLATTGFGSASSTPVVSPRTVIVSVVVGVVVSVLCSLVPAVRASRVPPIAAMREVATDDASRSVVRLVIGLVLVVVGVLALVTGANGTGNGAIVQTGLGTVILFAGAVILGPYLVPTLTGVLGAPLRLFGVAGALGRDNARRNPKRSAGTAAALMLSVTLITFIAVFFLSLSSSINALIDEDLRADLEVTGAGFGFPSLGPKLVDSLADEPDVAAVTGVQFGTVQIEGSPRPVFGVRFDGLDQIYDLGETEGDISALGPDQIAIDRATAELGLWGIGTPLDVTFPDGSTGTLTVGAIYESGGIVAQDTNGHYLISDQLFQERFPGASQFLNRIDLTGADGVSTEALRPVVERDAAEYPGAQVRDKGEIKEENNRQVAFALSIFLALLFLALVIGALGVAITIALSVFERTREIGLLRAVGATRKQLGGSITGESIVITLLGTVLGLIIGIGGGVATILAQSDAFESPRVTVSPVFVVGVLVMAVFIGILASAIPAFRATRLDVLDAVTVE